MLPVKKNLNALNIWRWVEKVYDSHAEYEKGDAVMSHRTSLSSSEDSNQVASCQAQWLQEEPN